VYCAEHLAALLEKGSKVCTACDKPGDALLDMCGQPFHATCLQCSGCLHYLAPGICNFLFVVFPPPNS
jgi:hypothetical protein